MNDTIESEALREITGDHKEYTVDVRPKDSFGHIWTAYDPVYEQYNRIDYLLVSHAIKPEVVRGKTRILSDPLNHIASDHRPLIVAFTTKDQLRIQE
ncbi:MAG: hypothetical protein GKR87_05780 [Kiritimatiellae bacterium]|nr:hypothetical protein [Kiritimatiellia bacterium]